MQYWPCLQCIPTCLITWYIYILTGLTHPGSKVAWVPSKFHFYQIWPIKYQKIMVCYWKILAILWGEQFNPDLSRCRDPKACWLWRRLPENAWLFSSSQIRTSSRLRTGILFKYTHKILCVFFEINPPDSKIYIINTTQFCVLLIIISDRVLRTCIHCGYARVTYSLQTFKIRRTPLVYAFAKLGQE